MQREIANRVAHALGATLAFNLAILVATGALLMTAYAPAPQTAWGSVAYVQHTLTGGWLVRGVHAWASDALLVLSGAQLAWAIACGLYERPLRSWYWLGLAVVALALVGAVTGHLLPLDQRGYWARKVEFNILGIAPGIGAWLQRFLQGGADLGALGLTRAYAAHALLVPLLFAVVIAQRAKRFRAHAELTDEDQRVGWIASLVLLLAITALAVRAHGAPLDAPADPLSDYPARPEWFLVPMYALRKYFKGSGEFWGTVGLPAAIGVYVAALPLLDKRPGGALAKRAALLAAPTLFVAALSVIGGLAMRHDANDADYRKAKAKAEALAVLADRAAYDGVPPTGPLDMPDLRGHQLFEKSCAGCHVLGDMGDPAKANAPALDGWGTALWLKNTMHDPDAADRFGRTPYRDTMPSVDAPKKKEGEDSAPMVSGPEELDALAVFLAAEGDEPGDPPRDTAKRERGKKLFADKCETCHTYGGEGDLEGSGTAPNLARYGSIAWTRTQIASPTSKDTYREQALDAPGAPKEEKGHMPAFAADLPASDIELLARWVRKTGRADAVR